MWGAHGSIAGAGSRGYLGRTVVIKYLRTHENDFNKMLKAHSPGPLHATLLEGRPLGVRIPSKHPASQGSPFAGPRRFCTFSKWIPSENGTQYTIRE